MFKIKNISELNRRIVIQSGTESRDVHGAVTKTWSTVRTCWAKVQPVLTSEITENEDLKRLNSISLTEFYIKYWDDTAITPKMRVYYHSKYYDIEYVDEVGDFDFLLLKARLIE